MRVKGVDRLAEREIAVLRVVAELREREAGRGATFRRTRSPRTTRCSPSPRTPPRRPPRWCASAASRASTRRGAAVRRRASRPPPSRRRRDAPRRGARALRPPARRPRRVRARRERESAPVAWRREEAKRRGVDEQVVLPGHCVKDTVDRADVADARGVSPASRGIGAFRVERDGATMRSCCARPARSGRRRSSVSELLVVAGEASGDRAAAAVSSGSTASGLRSRWRGLARPRRGAGRRHPRVHRAGHRRSRGARRARLGRPGARDARRASRGGPAAALLVNYTEFNARLAPGLHDGRRARPLVRGASGVGMAAKRVRRCAGSSTAWP